MIAHSIKYMYLRHDSWQVEDLSGEISHVAVEKHEQRLDDTCVRGEAGGKGTQDAVDGSHYDAAHRNHEEADHAEQRVAYSHRPCVRKLLEQVIQDLHGQTRSLLRV